MDFIDNDTDKEEYKPVHKIVLDGLVNNPAQTIQVFSIDFIDADGRHSHVFYMVEFTSSTYTLK